MKIEEAASYTEKCFHGSPASCTCACPFHLDIRSLLEKVSKGKWASAYKLLRNETIFPVIVSALCDQPCSNHCQRTQIGDQAISIRDLEDACIRYVKKRKADAYNIPPKTAKVAVVGAGLAGLSCALNLARKKFQVTVFDKELGWGGSIRVHLRFKEFNEEISLMFSVAKADFQFKSEITSLAQLEEFDAIYIATGSGGDSFGLLESWDHELQTTSEKKVFLGGSLCGVSQMEGIAQGAQVSKVIEAYIQTGKASYINKENNFKECGRKLDHDGALSLARVEAQSTDGYSEAEAREEASRCLQCDCDKCLTSCEMLKRFGKAPQKMAIEVYTDTHVNPPLSTHTLARETYSCNLCGHCKSICPEAVDIGAMLQFSRTARFKDNSYPAALHDFWLREMDYAVSQGAFVSAPKGKKTCQYAFFPGCQLGASNPEHVLESYDFLNEHYDAGIFISCCGAPAFWAGDEERLGVHIEKLRQEWFEMGRPKLVFACATCENIFSMMLPEIKSISLYELLDRQSHVLSKCDLTEAVVFDPCAARDDDEMQSSVRRLADKADISLEELQEKNRCCGYGGLIRLANPSLYDEISQVRAEASEKPYIVYCANCREVFAARDKECAHVLDIVFGLSINASIPSLAKKRENSLELKKKLMREKWEMDFEAETHEWDKLSLIIGDELQKMMDQKLISSADLQEAIWLAEESGDKFYDESDGMSLCSMIKPVITYWVEYRKTGPDTYEVYSAYYHRMHFVKGE
ncbi:MAG: hypothetical protein PWP30_1202 [Eubacteriaceae bacterium]|nr:hypothetical protein [Eubacteriaceae bacterium]